jgi:hypothetical protein
MMRANPDVSAQGRQNQTWPAAAKRGLARTVASGSDVNPLRNRRRSDMASPPETPRSFAEKSRYDPYRILPAEFAETKRSVRGVKAARNAGENVHKFSRL